MTEHSEYYRTNKTNLDKHNPLIEKIDKKMTAQLVRELLKYNSEPIKGGITFANMAYNHYASIRYNKRVYLINQCQDILNAHKSPIICHWVKAMIETFKQINQRDLPLANSLILINALKNNKLITILL